MLHHCWPKFSGHSTHLWVVHVIHRASESFHNRETHSSLEGEVWLYNSHQSSATSLCIAIIHIYSIFPGFLFSAAKFCLSPSSLDREYWKGCSCFLAYATSSFSYRSTARRWQMPEDMGGILLLGKKLTANLFCSRPPNSLSNLKSSHEQKWMAEVLSNGFLRIIMGNTDI